MHYFLVAGCGIAWRVRHFLLATEPWVLSQVTSCEICDGWSGTQTGFFHVSPVFPCWYLFHHCSILICHCPLRCAISLTRQHIISLVFKLRASSLTQHLAGYRARKLVFYILVKDKGGHEVIWLWHRRLIWRKLVVWTWLILYCIILQHFSLIVS
jgi:hypothetical protein